MRRLIGLCAAILTLASVAAGAETPPPHAGHPAASPQSRGPRPASVHDTLSAAELGKLHLPPAPAPPRGRPPRVTAVALDVRHMVFGSFHEREIVGMKDEFRIGDSEFTGRIIEFVPDWAMGLQSFKVSTRSNEPNNPGFRIVVRGKSQVRDTVWAFMQAPPHFARNSLLSFKVLRIEFADHAPVPIGAPDSAAARAGRKPDSTTVRGGRR